jgi:hypothetical protein
MKADRQAITREEFVEAAETVAAVLAATIWDRYHDEQEPIKRPATDSLWLDMRAARKYVKFGETKFRALRKQGLMPQGEKVGGKLMWDRRELDRCMEKLLRKAKPSTGTKRLWKRSDQTSTEQVSAKAQKPR